jgi:hypothetical protein
MFTSEPVDDKAAFAKMQRVEEVLRFFPEGMTQELGRGQETWIYLCKELAYADSRKSVDGFASTLGKHPIIFIDIECSDAFFKETLVHEISHVIDYCVDPSLLNGWLDLMPEDIANSAYTNSYNDVGQLDYTPYGDGKKAVWFYNSYSRTFSTEDRAVIFQKMYLSYIEGKMTDEFKKYDNLRKKASYYNEMLRKTFESWGDGVRLE